MLPMYSIFYEIERPKRRKTPTEAGWHDLLRNCAIDIKSPKNLAYTDRRKSLFERNSQNLYAIPQLLESHERFLFSGSQAASCAYW